MHEQPQDHPHQTYSPADEKLFSKVGWRLLPLLIVCYVISYIDRINIGYAQLQMEKTLSFSDAAYAFGAGIFFVGYFIFEPLLNFEWAESRVFWLLAGVKGRRSPAQRTLDAGQQPVRCRLGRCGTLTHRP